MDMNRWAIGTRVERTTWFTLLLHLPRMEGHGISAPVENSPPLADALRDVPSRPSPPPGRGVTSPAGGPAGWMEEPGPAGASGRHPDGLTAAVSAADVLLVRWDTKPDKRIGGTFLRPDSHRRTSFYAEMSAPVRSSQRCMASALTANQRANHSAPSRPSPPGRRRAAGATRLWPGTPTVRGRIRPP